MSMCRKYKSTGTDSNRDFTTKRNVSNKQLAISSLFYDMVKNGSSMGINVLSGLVRVDRGEEAVRSGLTGPRPLSVSRVRHNYKPRSTASRETNVHSSCLQVRVFGVPVYERGQRIRSPNNPEAPTLGGGGGRGVGAGGREADGEDEELPVY